MPLEDIYSGLLLKACLLLIWEQVAWHFEWSKSPRLPQPLLGQRRFFFFTPVVICLAAAGDHYGLSFG